MIELNKVTRFIHASDIHLGAKQYRNSYLADDHIRAFQKILSLGISKKVDFIIFGGDVFSSLDILPEQLSKIMLILQSFKTKSGGNIPLIAIEGNHDIRKYSHRSKVNFNESWLKFLAKLGLLILLDANFDNISNNSNIFENFDYKKQKGGKIRVKNAMIYGNHYLGRQFDEYLPAIKNSIKDDDGLFHILLQHIGIQGKMKGVPGKPLKVVEQLKSRLDYLALGHYHLGFNINNWIYNPGCPQAVSSIENSFNRGILFVEITKNDGKFSKKVRNIKLENRAYLWETIYFPTKFKSKAEIYDWIYFKLNFKLQTIPRLLTPTDIQFPILYLALKGNCPNKSNLINEFEMRSWLCDKFHIIDAKIYQKFEKTSKTLEKYMNYRKKISKTSIIVQ